MKTATKPQLALPDPIRASHYFSQKITFTTGPVELHRRIKDGDDIVIVDVRESEDFEKGHIPGAINLPKAHWDMPDGLRRDTVNVIYCYTIVCHLGASAAMQFADQGYPVMEMDGGFETWKEHDLPIDR